MDILETIAIELPCAACGSRYEISLRQVLLSQRMLHEGCPVPPRFTTECPPLEYADLVDPDLIGELEHTGLRLQERARAAGGRLVLTGGQGAG